MVRRLSRESLRRLVVNEARKAMRLRESPNKVIEIKEDDFERIAEKLATSIVDDLIDEDLISPDDGDTAQEIVAGSITSSLTTFQASLGR